MTLLRRLLATFKTDITRPPNSTFMEGFWWTGRFYWRWIVLPWFVIFAVLIVTDAIWRVLQ